MTTQTPSISIEHIHATLLTEIKDLIARKKTAKNADFAWALDLKAGALASIYSALVAPARDPKSIDVFEHIELSEQLFNATQNKEAAES